MKKLFFPFLLAFCVCALLFTSCKKDKDVDTGEESVLSSDESRVQGESEQAIDDVEQVMESASSAMGGKTDGLGLCGASIDSIMNSKTYVLTFDGTTVCNNRKREGVVKFQLTTGERWSDVGAQVTVTFENLKITRVSDNKSVMLNGTKVVTNVNGGKKENLVSENVEIVRRVTGSLSLTFDDGSVRSWNIARKRTFKNIGSNVIQLTIEGEGSADGYSQLAAWGTTRFNTNFYTKIVQPIVATTACGWNAPISGVKTHIRPARSIEATYGTNSLGDPITSGCPYGFKIQWSKANGSVGSAVVAY